MPYEYEKDGAAIYAESFATIRREAELDRFAPDAEQVVVRMIHAAGLVGLERDVAALDEQSLAGKKIGVARFDQGSNPEIVAVFDRALEDLKAAGAELVEIKEFTPSTGNFWEQAGLVLRYEFKASITEYLATTPAAVTSRSLDDLIAFNNANADTELALFDQSIFEESAKLGDLQSADYIAARDAVLQ